MRRAEWRALVSVAVAACIGAPAGIGAQQLAPLADGERCNGERIVGISVRTTQRDVVDRLGGLGAAVNAGLRRVQPTTRPWVIRRFLRLSEGAVCDEELRAESERTLRGQPFISDAVVRVRPAGIGEVRLDVETIDEFVIYSQLWGLEGVPAGLEVGTKNFLGRAKAITGLVEYNRGGEIGVGIKFTDYQAFRGTLRLDLGLVKRPLNDVWYAYLQRPFLTELQRSSWMVASSYDERFFTFRDPVIRDVSLEYARQRWLAGGVTRFGEESTRSHIGIVAAGESTIPRRTVAIREDGPVPVEAPLLLQRYTAFESTRLGLATGIRRHRYVLVRGLDALSAPQDIAIGWRVSALGLQSVGLGPNTTPDRLAVVNFGGTAGTPTSLVRWQWNGEMRFPRNAGEPRQSIGSGKVGWYAKAAPGHLSSIAVEAAGGEHTRFPLQMTFRDGDEGLSGFRGADLGGASRVIGRVENRFRIPSPTARAELAISALVEAGRLWAGDSPYGTNTPWHYGAGVALIAAIPAGSKQNVRFEFGAPVNSSVRRGLEVRIVYSDRTGFFWGDPGPIWLARETSWASPAVSSP